MLKRLQQKVILVQLCVALCTYNAISSNLKVLFSQRGLMQVTVKVTGCSERKYYTKGY